MGSWTYHCLSIADSYHWTSKLSATGRKAQPRLVLTWCAPVPAIFETWSSRGSLPFISSHFNQLMQHCCDNSESVPFETWECSHRLRGLKDGMLLADSGSFCRGLVKCFYKYVVSGLGENHERVRILDRIIIIIIIIIITIIIIIIIIIDIIQFLSMIFICLHGCIIQVTVGVSCTWFEYVGL